MINPKIYHSPYPTPHVPLRCSVTQFLLQSNPDDVSLDKPILGNFDDARETVSLRELRYHAARDSSTLKSHLSLKEADVVCIFASNSVAWVQLAHAVLWAGGCFCGINSLSTSHELIHYLEITRPSILAVDEELLETAQAALRNLNLKWSPKLVVIGRTKDVDSDTGFQFPGDFRPRDANPLFPLDLSARDNRTVPAGIIFSSGTSGKPKRVVLSRHNLIAYLPTLRATNPFTHSAHMREAFFPSFAHIYGIVSGVLLPAWPGNYVEPMKRFDCHPYLRRYSELRATVLRLVPAMAVRMIKDPSHNSVYMPSPIPNNPGVSPRVER